MSSKYFIILQQSRTLPLIQNLIYSNGKHDSGHPSWKIYRGYLYLSDNLKYMGFGEKPENRFREKP